MEERQEDKKWLRYISAGNIRDIMDKANKLGVTGEEFLSFNKSEGQYYLIYYK